jgi:hypothetical protein
MMTPSKLSQPRLLYAFLVEMVSAWSFQTEPLCAFLPYIAPNIFSYGYFQVVVNHYYLGCLNCSTVISAPAHLPSPLWSVASWPQTISHRRSSLPTALITNQSFLVHRYIIVSEIYVSREVHTCWNPLNLRKYWERLCVTQITSVELVVAKTVYM